jgi:hypothetical protein
MHSSGRYRRHETKGRPGLDARRGARQSGRRPIGDALTKRLDVPLWRRAGTPISLGKEGFDERIA